MIEPTFEVEKYRWIKNKLPLDLLNVDEELIELPVILQQASEFVSSAIEIRERAKDDLEQITSELADALRKVPLEGTGKFRSETQIDKQIPLSPLYRDKQDALGIARLDASLWQSLTDAIRTKSSSIRIAADLLNSGFLTPSYIREKRRKDIREVVST